MFDGLIGLAKKVFGDANERELKKLQPLVAKVNALESTYAAYDDAQLAAMTAEFRQRLANGAPLDDLQADAYAVVREAAKRTLGLRHYDCQLIGGAVLHSGRIAEMKTGEGKTLVATLPVYLNALTGKGVHVVTVNDYLASRDAEWMGRIYRFLGMSVGSILSNERNDRVKREAYAADITYGTNNEFGFDYLRDNMKFDLADYVQRGHAYGIVDEVDSILIDEARTPLIISGPTDDDVEMYAIIDQVIPLLQRDVDFVVDEKNKSVTLTDDGVDKIEHRLGVDNLFDLNNMRTLHHVNQALKAHHVFKRDKDYVVRDGEVIIVDEFTGRLMHGRRWSDGLHQAVEAKERVSVEPESQTYATITFQNLFRMYDKLAGMTGTAETEAAEFAAIYDLDTVVIPTNRAVARKDFDDIVYKTQVEKFRAVVREIRECREKGQPVLVGTTSVEKSEQLARMLERDGIPHEVLNAKNHAREALIVAQAGRLGAVTISTNMAGRGTDIKLGGNPEEMAKEVVDPKVDPDGYKAAVAQFRARVVEEEKQVIAAGGLHIIGTERHDSRRVDNQLRGRSGRQGDPGSSRFYLSLDDQLLRLFGTDKMTIWMERMGLKDDEPIEHRWITRSIENAQKKVEGHNFQLRKNLLEYDDVMNYQRKSVYDLRVRALKGEGIDGLLREAIDNIVNDIMEECLEEGHPEQWDITELRTRMQRIFAVSWNEGDDAIRDHSRAELRQRIYGEIEATFAVRTQTLGEAAWYGLARTKLLGYTDKLWKDHLLAVDRLRQGVSLRGYGQKNPLLEYKREAFHMFLFMSAMRDESLLQELCVRDVEELRQEAGLIELMGARAVARGNVRAPAPPRPAPALDDGLANLPGIGSAVPDLGLGGSAFTPPPRAPRQPAKGEEALQFGIANGLGRNDPCPCGSGQKFKKCCGASAPRGAAQPQV